MVEAGKILVGLPTARMPKDALPGKGAGYSITNCDACRATMWVNAHAQLLWEKYRMHVCLDCAVEVGAIPASAR